MTRILACTPGIVNADHSIGCNVHGSRAKLSGKRLNDDLRSEDRRNHSKANESRPLSSMSSFIHDELSLVWMLFNLGELILDQVSVSLRCRVLFTTRLLAEPNNDLLYRILRQSATDDWPVVRCQVSYCYPHNHRQNSNFLHVDDDGGRTTSLAVDCIGRLYTNPLTERRTMAA